LHCVRSAVRVAGRVLAFPPEKWKWKLCRCIRSLGFFVVRVGKIKVTVTPASKSLASFSCSLYGNKCQTSVSPWQSAGEIDFLCRSNGSTL